MTVCERKHAGLQPHQQAATLQPEHCGHYHQHILEDLHRRAYGPLVQLIHQTRGRTLRRCHNRREHRPPIFLQEARRLHRVRQRDDVLDDQAAQDAPSHPKK